MPYLPAPGTETIEPSPPLDFLRMRLRMSAIEEELFDDMHLLEHFSEAYQRACERSRALQAITEVALDGSQEYQLPPDHHRTLSVYLHGYELDRIPTRNALREGLFGYYEYGTTIGVRPTPPSGGSLFLLYARSPEMFAMYEDVPEAGFPPEFYHLLVHYARWKAATVAGGAQRIGQAAMEKDQFDLGVALLRTRNRRINSARPARVIHVLEHPRRRFAGRLGNDVDAG